MIYVKTRPGRRAYYEGKEIPFDKFVPVPDTPFIRRLANHWQDIEVESGDTATDEAPSRQPAKSSSSWNPKE